MKLRIPKIGIYLTLAILACFPGVPAAAVAVAPELSSYRLGIVNTTKSFLMGTLTPLPGNLAAGTSTPVPSSLPSPTITLSMVEGCDPGSIFSRTYLPDSAFIAEILPLKDGSFLLRGSMDGDNGTWLSKMDPEGYLLWQNLYGSKSGTIHLFSNGNVVLEFGKFNLEIAPDGSVVRGFSVPWYQPNPDGGYTILSGSSTARFDAAQNQLWQVGIADFGGYNALTADGGAIFAYAGVYTDRSVYYAPQYTDIKVIKVSSQGQVFQRVYGKLVGTENLDFLLATGDGGALLAGTHAYEELGSDYDIWLMKLNASGSLSWQSTLKLPPASETLRDIYPLKNGYLLVTSFSESDNPVLVRLKPGGSLAWQKIIRSSRGAVEITTAADTPDGGLLLAGETWEKTSVYWLARLDARGNLVWEKTVGYYNIPGAPGSAVEAILPLDNGEILIGGNTDLAGRSITQASSAWVARIQDSGERFGLLELAVGKFSLIQSLGGRPNTLPDKIFSEADITIKEITVLPRETRLKAAAVCLPSGASFPTPAALPSLTPSATPTPSFARALYLTDPPMQGSDVLKLQQRLLELGYTEVGIPDGIFGRKTQSAVRRFQERNGLEVDGYAGPRTLKALFEAKAIGN